MATIDHAAAYKKEDAEYELYLYRRCRKNAIVYEPPQGNKQWDRVRAMELDAFNSLKDTLERRLGGESPIDNYNRLNRLEDACLRAERLQKEDDINKRKCNELGVKYHRRRPGEETEQQRVDRFKKNALSIKVGVQDKKRKAMTQEDQLDNREMNRVYKRMSRANAKIRKVQEESTNTEFGSLTVDIDLEVRLRRTSQTIIKNGGIPTQPIHCNDPYCKCLCEFAEQAKRDRQYKIDVAKKEIDNVARSTEVFRNKDKVSSYLKARGTSIKMGNFNDLVTDSKAFKRSFSKVERYRMKQTNMAKEQHGVLVPEEITKALQEDKKIEGDL